MQLTLGDQVLPYHNVIDYRAQRHIIPRPAERHSPDDLAVGANRNVPPQVHRRRTVGGAQVHLPRDRMEVSAQFL